jgi:hypothetical protein
MKLVVNFIIIICFISNGNAQKAGWLQQTSPTFYNLYGVCFSNNIALAVGDGGTIIRSTDNGFNGKKYQARLLMH